MPVGRLPAAHKRRRETIRVIWMAALATAWTSTLAQPAAATTPAYSPTPASSPTPPYSPTSAYSPTPAGAGAHAACPPPTQGHAQCLAIVDPTSTGPLAASGAPDAGASPQAGEPAACFIGEYEYCGSGADHGFAPQDLESAYRLPSATAGSGQTVAIVDAYDDPNAQSDLNLYRSTYDLPACESGCFTKVNQEGGTSYPAGNSGWALEISLDLDMVSAACPKCHILLVEASTNSLTNLGIAEDEAAKLGASEISNSYASREIEVGKKQLEEDSAYYQHAKIPILAASGDDGYENAQFGTYEKEHCLNCSPSFPADLAGVVSVGGTSLGAAGETGRGWSEAVWFYSGSGCTLYVAKPSWQTDKGCKERTDNDVAADAALGTPVSVYDTYAMVQPGWQDVGGTSVATPLTAGAVALESSTLRSEGIEGIYKHPSDWFDVTEGSNYAGIGPACTEKYLCTGETGYDGPTGIGTPDGGASTTPPSAITGAASGVTSTGATLNAVTDAEASATTYYFEYGPTMSYGEEAPFGGATVTGYTKPDGLTQAVSGLKPQTEYHFRVVATSAGGTTYGADRVFWTAPKLYRTKFASKGTHEGMLESPQATATDAAGDIWVADSSNDRIEEFSPAGHYVRSCGSLGSEGGQLKDPTGIAVNPTSDGYRGGYVYVSDTGNNRIEVFSPECKFVEVIGAAGSWGHLSHPGGLAFGRESRLLGSYPSVLLVADSSDNRIVAFVWQLTFGTRKAGEFLGSYGTGGSGEGQFSDPTSIVAGAVESSETESFYVVDSGNDRVQEIQEKEGGTYKFIRQFGTKGSGEGQLSSPTGIVSDPSTGDILVTDTGNDRVEEFLPSGTYVAKFGSGGTGAEGFAGPAGLSVDAGGDLYIADSSNNRIDVWSRPEWRFEPTPNGPRETEAETESVLNRLSCTAWGECTAVGEYWNSAGHGRPLAESRKNGYEWSLESVPVPTGAKKGLLDGVSCASSSACTAVGEYETSGAVVTALAAGWNGKEWTLQSAAIPTGAKKTSLEGVSCPSSTACTAVGTYETGGGVQTVLAEGWNGSKWSVQATAKLPAETRSSHMHGVACTSSSVCVAVGVVVVHEAGSEVQHVLVERWNGSEWTSQLTAPEGTLYAVSCTSEKACMAVGAAAGKTSGVLGELWNGTEWSAQSIPQPEAGTGTLYDVSCGSSSSCLAVGRAGGATPIAERWNGSEWTSQSTSKPDATEHAGLLGVSCVPAGQCLGVGYFFATIPFGVIPETLGEVYP